MNRRSFLQGSAALGLLTTTTATRSWAQTTGPDPNLINAAISTHALSVANAFNGAPSASDWTNLASIYQSILADYQAKSLDSALIPAAQQVSAGQLILSLLNTPQLAAAVQAYQPAFTQTNIAQGYSIVPQDQATMAAILGSLQSTGFAPVLARIITRCQAMAASLGAVASADTHQPHLVYAGFTSVGPKPNKPACKPGAGCDPTGGGNYNCKTDGALNLAVGGALGIIGIMALPEVGVLAAGFWGATALWGGAGTLGWSFGHAVFCGF